MSTFPFLSVLTFFPMLAGVVLALFSWCKIAKDEVAKAFALVVTLLELVLALYVLYLFEANAEWQFLEQLPWIASYNINYQVAVDGISIYFVVLTALLVPICILASWHMPKIIGYMLCFLFLESFVIGSFVAADILLFYIFFEAVLIPMYLIIGIWGGDNRVYAAYKFFLYTLAGSVFLLAGIVYIYYQTASTDIILLTKVLPGFTLEVQQVLWCLFFLSFAVKVPMFPVHTWLPDAHVQAPTAGSVILAGILLKLGGYGFLRFSVAMFPAASLYFADFMMYLSIIAVVYTSLVALMQIDMKKMIAYSSVAHMGLVTAGIFSLNQQGIQGAIFQMVSHGLISGALFLAVGVLYERMHTKEIAAYGGVTSVMPKFALQFMFFMLASVGLPGTAGFVGEFLALLGVFAYDGFFAALMTTSLVLGAAYMLWLYARVMSGPVVHKAINKLSDLTIIERCTFWPLTLLVLFLGFYPSAILDITNASVANLLQHVDNFATVIEVEK